MVRALSPYSNNRPGLDFTLAKGSAFTQTNFLYPIFYPANSNIYRAHNTKFIKGNLPPKEICDHNTLGDEAYISGSKALQMC